MGRKPSQAVYERRLRVKEIMASGERCTIRDIAAKLGVSYATARNDVTAVTRGFVHPLGGSLKSSRDDREWSAYDNPLWCVPRATRDEALAEAENPTKVGRVEWYWPTVDAIQVIEALQADAVDFAGEYGEEWLDDLRWDSPDTDELQEMLQNAVEDWMRETKRMPAFFRVLDVEPVDAAYVEEAPC